MTHEQVTFASRNVVSKTVPATNLLQDNSPVNTFMTYWPLANKFIWRNLMESWLRVDLVNEMLQSVLCVVKITIVELEKIMLSHKRKRIR